VGKFTTLPLFFSEEKVEFVNCILKRPRTKFWFWRICCRLTDLLAIVPYLVMGSRYSRYNSHKKSNKMQQCIKILFHMYIKL